MNARLAAFALAACFALPTGARAGTGPLTIDVRDVDIVDVMRLLATEANVNVVADGSLKHEKISLRLVNVSFDRALATLTRAFDLQVHRDGGVLIVGAATAMNRKFADRGDPLSTRTLVRVLRNAKPDDLVKPLTDALPAGTVVVADKRTGTVVISGSETTLERARSLVDALDAPATPVASNVQTFALQYAKATDVVKLMKAALPDAALSADDRQNAVLVAGGNDVIAAARAFVTSIDVPSRQVMFEVRVADVQPQNDNTNVGIQLGGYDFTGQPIAGAATYAFAHNAIAINARLNALVQQGHASILATPRLVTVNNKEANLLIGQTYPIIYFDIRSGNQQVQNIDVGVKLRMTPTIGADGSITAELHPEYSAIQTFVGGYPVLANRRVDSTLRVRDGETIVLGGLLRDIDSETVTKIPILSDVPVFGSVFRNREHLKTRDEIVFLITPHIM